MVDEDPKPVVHPSPTLSGDEKVDYCYADMEEGIVPSHARELQLPCPRSAYSASLGNTKCCNAGRVLTPASYLVV